MNLAAEMARLPEPPNDSKPPLWNAWRHDLWQRAQSDDPWNFTRWPAIYHTMLVDHWRDLLEVENKYVIETLGAARQSSVEKAEAAFYAPNPVPRHKVSYKLSPEFVDSDSLNLTHQAYHILRWQEATGLRIADMQSVYEFGGGYGAMALVCNRLGFRGKYYIYDLPEFSLLQQWYLGECGVENVEWVDKDYWNDVDLIIACYSLSETDFNERDRILKAIGSNSYLFLYSNKFEQFDNMEYFHGLEYGEWNVYRWRHEHIDHLPPESWYTWGW